MLGHVSEAGTDPERVGGDVAAVDLDEPAVGWARPSSSRNSVVLPTPLAPTRPTEPQGPRWGQVVEGRDAGVALGQPVDAQQRSGIHGAMESARGSAGAAGASARRPAGDEVVAGARRRQRAPGEDHLGGGELAVDRLTEHAAGGAAADGGGPG